MSAYSCAGQHRDVVCADRETCRHCWDVAVPHSPAMRIAICPTDRNGVRSMYEPVFAVPAGAATERRSQI